METDKKSPTEDVAEVSQEEIEAVKANFIFEAPNTASGVSPVLPVKGQRNILITSALPYVNNVPHLGNIIGCVLSADIYARYSRQCGYNTLYVCGTDEYGTATETKALAENLTPRQICDKYYELHRGIYEWFNIGFDHFGRTTSDNQTKIVQEIFMDVYNAGFIDTQVVEQLLCEKCDRYLADRFVEGICPFCKYEDARGDQCDKCGKLINAIELIEPRCKVCSTSPVVRQSKQFFLDLPKIEPKLKSWFSSVEQDWTNNARVITKSWIKEGLKPRCITRDLKWGIPVPIPEFANKVFYVWFDAPIGYMSITSCYCNEWRQWWQPDQEMQVELFQFMAKDNVPFHSVMFPSTLLAVDKGYSLVTNIMATEYLNYESGKFSKSRGVGVFGNDVQETGIEADIFRFYLASARPEAQDASFSWSDLVTRNNSELLNNLGNFINRGLVFCAKNFDSKIPELVLDTADYNLISLINREIQSYTASMEKAKFRDAIKHLLTISRHGNLYMQTEQPWVLAKGSDAEKIRAGTVVGLCCNISCILSAFLCPFMPATSQKLDDQLNIESSKIKIGQNYMRIYLKPGHVINKPIPLFTKIDVARIEELKNKFGGVQQAAPAALSEADIKDLEDKITAQAEKVRTLKSSATDKSVWQPEVNILLELKKKLTAAQGKPEKAAENPKKGKKGKK